MLVTCSGLLFDLDGTLIDSGDAVVEAWTAFAKEINRDPAEILEICHGVRTVEVIQSLGMDEASREKAVAVESYIVEAGSTPIPGAVEFLSSLPAGSWGVVTSSLTETAWSRFERTELPAPAFIVSADDVTVGKPDPAGYLMGATKLGLEPSECLVFEDATAGVAAANNAGITCIALETTNPASLLAGANYLMPDLRSVKLKAADPKPTGGWDLQLEVDAATD